MYSSSDEFSSDLSRRRAGRAVAAMPAAPAPVLAQPDHDPGLVFRTLAASALRRGMVAFRRRSGSLPEAAHPAVEGSRPGARRHVAHAAVAARPGLGPAESSPA